ncbi:hypothetical protein [Amycolatopsis sp. NPDC050768]|uniref:hypothetical protein n=1 Tax=Amycolatopsis sp. NPDC050768 TaxID=3154839 RepID=UPI0033E493E5
MHIQWNLLGLVFLASFAAAVAVIVLVTLGIAALAPTTRTGPGRSAEISRGLRYTVAALCFAASALIIGYGIYVIVAK